jgi:hypothetical protein
MYLGTIVTDQNCIHKDIKSRLNLGNACYHSVQSHLSVSSQKNLHIKIYRTIILLVLYGFETCSVTLRGKQRLRVYENRVLGRIFGPKREGVVAGWRRLHNEELCNLYASPIIIIVVVVVVVVVVIIIIIISLAPQPSLGFGLLHKIQLNFLEASQQFSFLHVRVVSPTPSPHPRGPGLCIYIPQRQGGYPF